jgi:hypothetical protein
MSSPAQIAANRANAKLSTGPASDAGKAKSSLNALKTGLTGRTILLPDEDPQLYQAHVESFFDEWKPAGERERSLVQAIAETEWRLMRIPTLEAGIYDLGQLEFAELFLDEDPTRRARLIKAKILMTYQRQFNNLSIQENRLCRRREKDTATLRQLQAERKQPEEQEKESALPSEIGFEFSTEQKEPVRAVASLDQPTLPPAFSDSSVVPLAC